MDPENIHGNPHVGMHGNPHMNPYERHHHEYQQHERHHGYPLEAHPQHHLGVHPGYPMPHPMETHQQERHENAQIRQDLHTEHHISHIVQENVHNRSQPNDDIHEIPISRPQESLNLSPAVSLIDSPRSDAEETLRQEIRAKLEKLASQINDLNGSDQFMGRFHLSSHWRINSSKDTILYISVLPNNPIKICEGLLSRTPTFHLVAEGHFLTGEILMRLVAFNGKVIKRLDEQVSENEARLRTSKLLNNYVEDRFTLCPGIGRIPRKNQIALFNKCLILFEKLNERSIIRSQECAYAIEKSNDNDTLKCCPKCQDLAENHQTITDSVKEEPLDDSSEAIGLNPQNRNRLEMLKQKGIEINPTQPRKRIVKPPIPLPIEDGVEAPLEDTPIDDDIDTPLPHLMVTVTLGKTKETKIVPFDRLKQLRQQTSPSKKRGGGAGGLPGRRPDPDWQPKKKAPREKRVKLEKPALDIDEDDDNNISKESIVPPNDSDIPDYKSCSVCQEVFHDVNLFMTHLMKCKPPEEKESEEEEPEEDDGADDLKEDLDENGVAKAKAKKKKKLKRKKTSFPLTALSCCICGQSFKSETHFDAHMKAHEEKLELNKEVACPVCEEKLSSKRHLNPHFKMNHPNEGACCVECLQIMEVDALKNHMMKIHQASGTSPEGHLCPDCGKKCQYLSELEIHIAIQHMGMVEEMPTEQELMCHECGKVFNTRKKLKHHLSNTHKSRDHPCQFCAKIFCHRHQLTKHMLTHSDIKPFKCKYCEYQNARKYRVINHCQKAHNIEATENDIEVMKGGNRPAEFLQNFMNIS